MNGRKGSLKSELSMIMVALLLASALMVTLNVQPIKAESDTTYPLNSMWVSPSTINYDQNNASVGTLFNLTVWAYMQNGTYDWQVMLDFDASVFQEVACGYTDGATSAYFAGHTTLSVSPFVDNVQGSILFGESLIGTTDYVPQNNASLMYAEFNITNWPTAPINSTFSINSMGTLGTFFEDTNGNTINSASNLYDATLTLTFPVPPPTPPTIYINADGSITPPGAPIVISDNITYTFTDNVTSGSDGVIINRDNVVLNGAGYTIVGPGGDIGVWLEHRSNVTIENLKISAFENDIFVGNSSGDTILGNTLTNGDSCGVDLAFSTNNTVLGNRALDNTIGIGLLYSANNTIGDNIVTSNFGIGITLYSDSSVGNVIFGNNLTDNPCGIEVEGSDNTLIANSIVQSSGYGILFDDGYNSTLRNNSISNCKFNLAFWGISPNDIDTSNTVNGKPIYYLVNKQDMTVPLNAGYIALVNCTGITVKNQNLDNSNEEELFLADTTDSLITENNITSQSWAIWSQNSNNNTITENTFTDGLFWLDNSSNNKIFHNNFLAGASVNVNQGTNTFDNGYPSGGNYWSDYTTVCPNATEIDSSGIWNTPYVIDANDTDQYPLMEPYCTLVVTNITCCTRYDLAYVYQGTQTNITVTVCNGADSPQKTLVTLFCNLTDNKIIDTYPLYLEPGQNFTLTFVWNTAGIPCLNYTLSAVATLPTGFTSVSTTNLTVRLVGDVNGDGRVDLKDMALVAHAFGSTPTSPNWNPAADLNGDGTVNMQDIALAARHFGQYCQ
jgi:parallel beta-helix repeat protein